VKNEFKFGEELENDLDWPEVDYLGEWSQDGCMSIYDWEPSEPTIQFVLSQFARFNIPFTGEMMPLIESCYYSLLYYLNHYDPYCIYSGLTEVQITDHWKNFSYCLTAHRGMSSELPAERLETYKLYPGDDEVIFNDLMSKPGLDAISQISIEDELFYEGSYFDLWGNLDSAECHRVLNEFCTKEVDGEWVFFRERKEAYAKLTIWACLMHIISPEMREFRKKVFPLIGCCYETGECIIYENEIFDSTFYTKQERMPLSCSECGIVSWCVELAQLGNTSRYICESCLNGNEGVEKRPYACGLKMCPVVRCPNHPQHGDGTSGIGFYRSYGQLNDMAAENTRPSSLKGASAKLLKPT